MVVLCLFSPEGLPSLRESAETTPELISEWEVRSTISFDTKVQPLDLEGSCLMIQSEEGGGGAN